MFDRPISSEWFMAIGASMGYENANAKALDLWQEIYGTENLTALTDTFTTEVFFKVFIYIHVLSSSHKYIWYTLFSIQDFTADRARLWRSIRQDSGDPFVYAPRAKVVYESLGINPLEHFIVFSDNLTVELAKKLQKQCDDIGMKGRYSASVNADFLCLLLSHFIIFSHVWHRN